MGLVEPPAYDVVIIGGGIAGLSAALVLGRSRRRVAVVDAGKPRNSSAAHAHGYLTRDGTPPAELIRIGREEVSGYGVDLIDETVTGVSDGRVETGGGRTLLTRHVVLAMGLRDILPEIGGAEDRWGRDLLQCPYCHGWGVRDRKLGVLGAGESSLQQALLVRQFSSDVTLFLHEMDDVPGNALESLTARGVALVPGRVTRLIEERGALSAVELEGGGRIECEALFTEALSTVDVSIINSLDCRVSEDGCIITDDCGRTSVEKVWAVGNAADPAAQLISAAGDAYRVAVVLNAELIEQDVASAVRLLEAV